MSDIVNRARAIATKAHEGQFRRDGKTPYIVHPEAVAAMFPDDCEFMKAAALLHDVIEDSNVTAEDLTKWGMPTFVVFLVQLLSKKKGQSYLEYILSISCSHPAKEIKIADIQHNILSLEEKNNTMRDKYMLALYILKHHEGL